MQGRQRIGWKVAVSLLAPVILIAGCGNSKEKATTTSTTPDLHGKVVTIFGTEVGDEAQGFINSLKPFEDRTGIDVQYQGDKSFETQIGVRVDGGNAPDIALFPQPGKVKDFASDLKALPTDVVATAGTNFDKGWTDLGTVNGKLVGLPIKADLKDLIWYNPKLFAAAGYKVPTTFDEFLALSDKMIADKKAPFCLGLGSDAATGWPATDWVEDFMLRMKGPEVYDKWVNHEIAFDSADVVEVGQAVQDLWSKSGAIYGGEKAAASTPFQDAGLPVQDGKCMMYRMANFYAASFPKTTKLGPDGDVSAFYFPGNPKFGNTTLTGGLYAAGFADRPEVAETFRYLASTEYANNRAPVSGYLSPNKNVDATKYGTPIEQQFASILSKANPVRFDGSDQMPGAVGSGTFWTAEVDITSGAKTVPAAYKEVEASWPKK